MKPWMRSLSAAFLAATTFTLLGGCNDSEKVAVTRLNFGTGNIQPCEHFYVAIDLAAAESILARKSDGSVDCALGPVLASGGCEIDFTELDGGNTLQVTIADCEIPEISNLFECGFTAANAAKLMDSMDTRCTCAGEPVCDMNLYCIRRPDVCVNEARDPGACEDCFNSIDDDGDGFTDCDDANCYIVDCGVGQTTITCEDTSTSTTVTTSTTNTSMLSTTSTTVPVEGQTIVFRLESAQAAVGALQFSVDYAAADGDFAGSGATVECTGLVEGALFAPNELDDQDKLSLGFIALNAFAAPLNLAECTFVTTNPGLQASDFVISIDDATDAAGGTIAVSVVAVLPAPL